MFIRSFSAAFFLTAFFIGGATAQSDVIPASVPVSDADRVKVNASTADAEPAETGQTAPNGYTRPTAKKRFDRYIKSMVGPFSLARQVAGAGIGTWRNSPEEWGGQWEGFGKRLASGFGKNVIKQTTIYGLDEALKLDSGYYRATGKSTGAKIKNALISPVTALTPSGRRTVGVPRLVGTYTASIVAAETWYPDRYDWKDGVRSGTMSLGVSAAFNRFKEFVWKK